MCIRDSIKKENIGLIEVMGLAVLPGRLKKEMADLREALLNGENLHVSEELSKHADWADAFMARHPEFNAENAEAIIPVSYTHLDVYKRQIKGGIILAACSLDMRKYLAKK